MCFLVWTVWWVFVCWTILLIRIWGTWQLRCRNSYRDPQPAANWKFGIVSWRLVITHPWCHQQVIVTFQPLSIDGPKRGEPWQCVVLEKQSILRLSQVHPRFFFWFFKPERNEATNLPFWSIFLISFKSAPYEWYCRVDLGIWPS